MQVALRFTQVAVLFCLLAGHAFGGLDDPWADRVTEYVPGDGPVPGYDNPQVALGPPERFTGEGAFPSVVSMFNPPFGTDEIVSIGAGGSLTVEFDPPILDSAANRYGVDLIVFGNGGFIDFAFPDGQIGPDAEMFGVDAMRVSVSSDGLSFVDLGEFTEGVFPTQGYLDAGPFDPAPGNEPTAFTRPIDPSLTPADFAGLSYAQALALYDGSGGGTPVDIGPSGLDSVRFVRIETPSVPGLNVEIDAFAAVPEPAPLALFLLTALSRRAFRRKKRAANAERAPFAGAPLRSEGEGVQGS